MLNQVIVVGRIVREPTLQVSENNKKYMNITIAVPRSFKNSEGVYETDYIDCILWDVIASSTSDYCNKGDVIGIRGRIQTRVSDDKDGNKKYYTDIVGEKVTFFSKITNNDESKKVSN